MPPTPILHHVAVQTSDLETCVSWYREFFGAVQTWELSRFSELTRERLPGITRLVEVQTGGLRFHLFERQTQPEPLSKAAAQFQHVCLQVESRSSLDYWRQRWFEVERSGRYTFAEADHPTAVVVDDDGTSSFYAKDVNGLEFEFTHVFGGD